MMGSYMVGTSTTEDKEMALELATYTDCKIEHLKAIPGFDVIVRENGRTGTISKITGQAAVVMMDDTLELEQYMGNELSWK